MVEPSSDGRTRETAELVRRVGRPRIVRQRNAARYVEFIARGVEADARLGALVTSASASQM